VVLCTKISGPEWEIMLCAISISRTFTVFTPYCLHHSDVRALSGWRLTVTVGHNYWTPILLSSYNFQLINKSWQSLLKYIDCMLGYAKIRTRPITSHLSDDWPKWTRSQKRMTTAITSSLAIAERLHCRVGWLWPKVEDWNCKTIFYGHMGLSSTTVM